MPADHGMSGPRRESDREIRNLNVMIISFVAACTFIVAVLKLGYWGSVLWLAYAVVGAIAMRISILLVEIIAEEQIDVGVFRSAFYVGWPLILPVLFISMVAVVIFRFALDHLG